MGLVTTTRGAVRALIAAVCRLLRGGWNTVSLVILVAVAATVPLLQLAVLGYLIEVSGRMAREPSFKSLCLGSNQAGRWARWLVGSAICFAPLWIAYDTLYSTYLINGLVDLSPNAATGMWFLAIGLSLHWVTALYAGGRWRHFLWPCWFPVVLGKLVLGRRPATEWFAPAIAWKALRHGRFVDDVCANVARSLGELRLGYLLWLGFRAMVATLLWLAIPVAIMAVAFQAGNPNAAWLGAVGALGYGCIAFYLPYLQTRFATEGRWGVFWRIGPVRQAYRQAPIVMSVAWMVFFGLSVPLYLLKIEYTPRELDWLPAVVFVVLGLLGRWAVGWAWGYAERRPRLAPRLSRWLAGCILWPAAIAYMFLVFISQYTSWHGTLALLEQPALLLPIPFWLR